MTTTTLTDEEASALGLCAWCGLEMPDPVCGGATPEHPCQCDDYRGPNAADVTALTCMLEQTVDPALRAALVDAVRVIAGIGHAEHVDAWTGRSVRLAVTRGAEVKAGMLVSPFGS